MLKARSTLLENFDESVKEKLRDNLVQSQRNLDQFEKRLWLLAIHALKGKADFYSENYTFKITSGEYAGGIYYLSKQKNVPENETPYRMGLPLVQQMIARYKNSELPIREVDFYYSKTEGRTALLEELIGKEGTMLVEKLSIDSFEQEDHLLIACRCETGEWVYPEIAERMLMLPAKEIESASIDVSVSQLLQDKIEEMQNGIVTESAERNNTFFDEEMDKLDNWADDMKLGLEKEISDLDNEIRLRKSEAKKLSRLEEKVAAQRAIKDLEKRRTEKRQNLYEAQDEIDERKDALLTRIEKMLAQKVERTELFTIKWKLK